MERSVAISWRELLDFVSPSSKVKSQKCQVRLLDTIFLDPTKREPDWYFTTKNGAISKKKEGGGPLSSVVERFSRFALANPNNNDGVVGAIYSRASGGSRRILNADQLNEFLSTEQYRVLYEEGTFLQVFLRPYRGRDVVLLCNYTREGSFTFQSRIYMDGSSKIAPCDCSESVKEQMTSLTTAIVNSLGALKGVRTNELSAEYILDDNEHIWLSTVRRVTATAPADSGDKEIESLVTIESSPRASMSSLPQLRPRSGPGESSSRPVSSSAPILDSYGAISSDISRNDGRVSSSNSSGPRSTDAATADVGELLLREGSVYRCTLGSEELPGLRTWIMTSIEAGDVRSSQEKDVPVWNIDMNEYCQKIGSPDAAAVEVRRQRAAVKQLVPYELVALIRQAEPLLLGKVSVDSPEDFESLWQQQYELALQAVSRKPETTPAEVVACGNTLAISRKLDSLRNVGFRSRSRTDSYTAARVGSALPVRGSGRQVASTSALLDRPNSGPELGATGGASSAKNGTTTSTLTRVKSFGGPVGRVEGAGTVGSSSRVEAFGAGAMSGSSSRVQAFVNPPDMVDIDAIVGVGEQALEDSMDGNNIGDDENNFDLNVALHQSSSAAVGASGHVNKGSKIKLHKDKDKEKQEKEKSSDTASAAGSKVKSIYGASVVISAGGGKTLKGKNVKGKDAKSGGTGNGTGASIGGPAFNRNSMDAPPNLDLIAKFAVEKEKHQRLTIDHGYDDDATNGAATATAGDHYDSYTNRTAVNRSPKAGGKKPKKGVRKSLAITTEDTYFDVNNGPMSIEETELRLAQLENMASKTLAAHQLQQQIAMQQYMPPMPMGGLGMNNGMMMMAGNNYLSPTSLAQPSSFSVTEAEFMLRQASAGDISALGGVPDPDKVSVLGGQNAYSLGGGSSLGAVNKGVADHGGTLDKVADALRDRVATLEKQVSNLSTALQKREQELGKSQDKLRQVAADYDKLKRAAREDKENISVQHERDLLALKQQHLKEMATIAVAPPPPAQSSSPSKAGKSVPDPTSMNETNRQLLAQLDAVRMEHKKVVEKYEAERYQMIADVNNKMNLQEIRLKNEITDLRQYKATLEDQLTQTSDDLANANSKAAALGALVQQVERARDEALDGQKKLRADLKSTQQSVTQTFRLDGSTNLGHLASASGAVDPETAIKLNEAKSEAKLRQMANKLEFMKAQLASEQSSTEELRKQLEASHMKLDELRGEFKLRLQDADRQRDEAVAEAENRVSQLYEERMSELTTLQARMMSVQGQLQDAFHETSTAKQREDAAKTASAKAQAQQIALKTEVEQLKSHLQSIKDEQERELSDAVSKQNYEATVRRLDNERQYLKSQLASEITHKNELQAALVQCQQQLSEVRTQWTNDVTTLKETNERDTRDSQNLQTRLEQQLSVLEAEVSRLQAANADLKSGYQFMRDQVRTEQLTSERTTTLNRRLGEELEVMRNEAIRSKKNEEQLTSMHEKQVAALNSLLSQQENVRGEENQRLREELSNQYRFNASAQQQIIDMARDFEKERRSFKTQAGAQMLLERLKQWRQARIAAGFRQWYSKATLVNVASQFRSQLKQVIADTVGDEVSQKQKELQQLRADLEQQHDATISQLRQEFEIAAEENRKRIDTEREEWLAEKDSEFELALHQIEGEWRERLVQAQEAGEQAVLEAIRKKDEEMTDVVFRCDMDIAKAAGDNDRAMSEAERKVTQKINDEWERKLKDFEFEMQEGQKRAQAVADVQHDQDLRAIEKKFNDDMEKMRKEMEDQTTATLDEVKKRHQQNLDKQREDLEKEKQIILYQAREEREDAVSVYRKEAYEAEEKRIRELRGVWAEELQSRLDAKDEECNELVEKRMLDHNVAMEAERARGLKLEASKWKQALKDSEKRQSLEAAQARVEGREEREQELRIEIAAIEERYKMLQNAASDKHRFELEAAARDKADALLKQQADLEIERDNQVKLALQKHDEEWSKRLTKELESSWKQSEAAFKSKMDKKQDQMDELKKDITLQMQRLATERNDLQERVSESEEMMKKLEELKDADQQRLLREFNTERELLQVMAERKQREELDALRDRLDKETGALIAEERERFETRLNAERTQMTARMDLQMKELQEDSEKMVDSLETAIDGLRKEKKALADELGTLAKKLEDTEDAHYDSEQQMKRRMKEQSIALWRAVANLQKMKNVYQEGLSELDKRHLKDEERLKKEMQGVTDKMVLRVMWLTHTVMELETMRRKMHTVLMSHKIDELGDKRTKIVLLEKELERLADDQKVLEEQRKALEDEVEHLEEDVRDVEDQIRHHNRQSSMQNGRINVAHARKKRRLDAELERLLELIEQKREAITSLEDRIGEKGTDQNKREEDMVDLEKQLMMILMEQQKVSLGVVQAVASPEERVKEMLTEVRIPWPPPKDANQEYVNSLFASGGPLNRDTHPY